MDTSLHQLKITKKINNQIKSDYIRLLRLHLHHNKERICCLWMLMRCVWILMLIYLIAIDKGIPVEDEI